MRWLLVWCFAFAAAPAFAQSNCLPDAAAKAAASVHQRQAELLQVKVEEMTLEVAPPLQVKIRVFKDALASAVDAAVACAAVDETADAMQARLAKMLDANQPEKPFQPSTAKPDAKPGDTVYDDKVYGDDIRVAVSVPVNAPELRAIEISFGIECGNDTLLLVYEAKPNGWQRTLRWQSGDYKEISGAFGDFFVNAMLPEGSGGLRVVVAHGTPWCTSRFSGFKLDVLAPTPSGGARVVWHADRDYSRGDFGSRLKTVPSGFELRLNAPALDAEGYERTVIYHYQVVGDHVERVGPIATNSRGFVEEWLSMPWDEAKAVTASEAASAMKAIHEQIAEKEKNEKTYMRFSYGPVRACRTKGQYEVEMDADPGGPQFFAIREGQSGYVMVNYGTTQDKRCTGPDIMKKK